MDSFASARGDSAPTRATRSTHSTPATGAARRRTHRMSVLAVTATLVAAVGTGSAHAAAPAWTQADLPVPAGDILALAQVGPHTVWAAGFADDASGQSHPVLLAEDGADGAWRQVATPADNARSRFSALSARGSSDVWLVGDAPFTATQGTPILAEHWNGRSWQVVPVPVPANSQSAGLLGVVSRGPDDVWAVGSADLVDSETYDPATGITDVVSHTEGLLEHWDGTAWHRVALPADATDVVLTAITATSAGDLWVTGATSAPDATTADQPVVLHGDARGWRSAALPATGEHGELNAVAAAGPDDVWAVGHTMLSDTDHPGHPLVEHWDGRGWRAVTVPGEGRLGGVAVVPGGVAVVGYDEETGTAYGQRLTGGERGRWTSLGLSQTGDYDVPQAVAATSVGLVVAGSYGVAGGGDFVPLVQTARR